MYSFFGSILNLKSLVFYSNEFYFWFGVFAIFSYALLSLYEFREDSNKFLNSRGYAVLKESKELEHHHVAELVLGRSLRYGEIVHHINGIRTDNEIGNLCVMNRLKHELFHSWLSWKKKKSGRYPSYSDQKRILKNEFGGILLEDHMAYASSEKSSKNQSPFKAVSSNMDIKETDYFFSRKLYDQLRAERQRIAHKNNIKKLYQVCDNRAIFEMTINLPNSLEEISNVKGFKGDGFHSYCPFFLAVIKRFKQTSIDEAKNKDTA